MASWQRFSLDPDGCVPLNPPQSGGNGQPPREGTVPPAPAWRRFLFKEEDFAPYRADVERRWDQLERLQASDPRASRARERARSFHMADTVPFRRIVDAVNAAIHLRRPLLLTGTPGSGKTSLAYAIAERLQLGPILRWAITPRATLREALYSYDAVARLQAVQAVQAVPERSVAVAPFLKLGPLGTAFLPWERPRVVLIDEIDKCDMNLPNELLELFEEGEFSIPELVRETREREARERRKVGPEEFMEGQPSHSEAPTNPAETPLAPPDRVETADPRIEAEIRAGRVICREFPLLILTSNGEREFPPAFNRRCIRARMPEPSGEPEVLRQIVRNHLCQGASEADQEALLAAAEEDIQAFANKFSDEAGTRRIPGADLSVDQLLNLVFVLHQGAGTAEAIAVEADAADRLRTLLLQALGSEA